MGTLILIGSLIVAAALFVLGHLSGRPKQPPRAQISLVPELQKAQAEVDAVKLDQARGVHKDEMQRDIRAEPRKISDGLRELEQLRNERLALEAAASIAREGEKK
jgi:hypothetical protein